MFTGRLPHELRADWVAPLGARFPTLAGYLGSRGYATAGFVAKKLYCGYDTGLADGFTHYEDYNLREMDAFLMARLTERALLGFFQLAGWLHERGLAGPLAPVEGFVERHVFSGKRKDAATVNADFLAWLAGRREPGRPFFAFLNYFDAHEAYFPPRPTDYRFGLRPSGPADALVLQNWEAIDKPALDPRFKTLASDCYDDCIRSMDDQLNALFATLGRQGLLDRTLVIVTADHGEGFGEHDLYVHGDSLYQPEVHVPLLILPPAPRPAPAVVGDTVSLLDLPATVVGLLGLAEGSPFPGRSLARSWDRSGSGSAPSGPAVSELASPNPTDPNHGRSPARLGPLTALSEGRYTYIYGGGKEELFDTLNDPGEQLNLAGDASKGPELSRFRAARGQVLRP
jgi:arylsulfatase A-like enzyme